jgi:hypothetical protein
MSLICEKLHSLLRDSMRFGFSIGYEEIPLNGIYIMFERGEFAHGGDRIVRIGTHKEDGRLKKRITQHYKKTSIFRGNIGRCILLKEDPKHPYLSIWDHRSKIEYRPLRDMELEAKIGKEISRYIQENVTFCVLKVPEKDKRIYFEARLIGTVSCCEKCFPSETWFGQYSPKEEIKKSGLWQISELYSNPLSDDELQFISSSLVRKGEV